MWDLSQEQFADLVFFTRRMDEVVLAFSKRKSSN
jgi:hypothetical protein